MKKINFYFYFLVFWLFYIDTPFAVSSGTYTVNQWGTGNFTSLVSAEAGLQGVLISTCYIVITGSWTVADNEATFSGWTTYSTAPIIVQATGLARCNGIWNDKRYRISATANYSRCIYVEQVTNIRVDGIQMNRGGDFSKQPGAFQVYNTNSETEDIQLSNCIIKNTCDTGGSPQNNDIGIRYIHQGTFKIWNNIIYGFGYGIQHLSESITGSVTYYIYNNTWYETNTYSGGASLYFTQGGNPDLLTVCLKNNLVFSTTQCYYLGSYNNKVSISNISNDQTSPDSALRGLNAVYLNVPTNNYQPVSTDTSTYQGINLNPDTDGNINIISDIAGNTRASIPTIGAWERQTITLKKNNLIVWQGE
jgi:hypothetical protein